MLDYDRQDTYESISISVNPFATWITHLVYNIVIQSAIETEIKNLNMAADQSTWDCHQLSTNLCQILLIANQMKLVFPIFGNVFMFNDFTYATSSSIIVCDETVIKLCIRSGILILYIVIAISCDTTSTTAIRFVALIDIIDNKARGGIIFDGTINIPMQTEILMAILTVDELFQSLLKLNQFVLLPFDYSTTNTNITTHSSLFTIIFFNNKISNAICIRIAFEISTNSCKISCDSSLGIVTKFIRLNDMIDNPITTGIIFDSVVDIGIKIEFFLMVFIAYCIGGAIQSIVRILCLIGAIIYITALIFGILDSISPAKAQNKVKKQS